MGDEEGRSCKTLAHTLVLVFVRGMMTAAKRASGVIIQDTYSFQETLLAYQRGYGKDDMMIN